MRKVRLLDTQDMYRAAAEHVAARSAERIQADGRFVIALTGGESPRPLYRILAQEYLDRVDWSHWEVFWGDERCVPPDDRASNFCLAKETLLDHVPVPPNNIHRMRGEEDPHGAAARYEREVREALGQQQAFDLILLGMGADGHVASLFPGTLGLLETDRLVVANFAPDLKSWRITFTFPLLNQAKNVVLLVASPEKREALNAALKPGAYGIPASHIDPMNGDVCWYVSTDVQPDLTLVA